MQADNVQAGVKDLAKKLVSLDPVDFDSAVNQYFEAHAVLESPQFAVNGASRIKQWCLVQTYPASESKLVGEPRYDEKTQIATFSYQRTYITPYIPVASFLSQKRKVLNFDAKLRLNVVEDDEVDLLVTKASVRRRELAPFEGFIPWDLFRPLLSFAVIGLFVTAGFLFRHNPKQENIAAIGYHAVVEAFQSVWIFLIGEKERVQAKATKYGDAQREKIMGLVQRARSTAGNLKRDAEVGAEKAGDEFDQIKQSGVVYLEEAIQVVDDTKSKGEDKAQELSTEARAYASGFGQKVQGVAEDVESRVEGSFDEAQQDVPEGAKTPLGGNNPQAYNAPSYAQAAME
ncbi:hypothetical protein BCR39DRAFT_257183 [Naematelia encephala]|uniref:Uncharacterized protein n=1 Tax=Naematelia encephala TaxID=71784 RepID=A0A1Y2AX90_9TREE|nr:hypothetical protein BCR39DRAFT_257183 [Naematelia encephala]